MSKEYGFSLIEVSVAALLIMLGVTGYVTLQSEYVLGSSQRNLRHLALNLAQEKLSDLAYFQQLNHLAGMQSYEKIATNLGGRIPAGERDVMLSSSLDLKAYDTQWQVENVYFVDTNFDGMADTWVKVGDPFFPSDLPRYADLKNVQVTVSWFDMNGAPKKLDILGSIAPITQSQSFQVQHRSASTAAVP